MLQCPTSCHSIEYSSLLEAFRLVIHGWFFVHHYGDVGRASYVSTRYAAMEWLRLIGISNFTVGLQDGGPCGSCLRIPILLGGLHRSRCVSR